jgi:hypothetical protein
VRNMAAQFCLQDIIIIIVIIITIKIKISSSIFDSVSVRIPTRTIRDYSIFMVNHNFKVNPSARCVLLPMLFARTFTFLTRFIFR